MRMRGASWEGQRSPHRTPHFEIHHRSTDRRSGTNSGVDRVSSRRVLEAYAQGLEEAYEHLSNQWGRECQQAPTRVEVCDVRRHRFRDTVGVTFQPSLLSPRVEIALAAAPCGATRSGASPAGALLADELRIARAVAIHECVHLFNVHQAPLDDPKSAHWRWLDEGTALFHEWELCGARGVWLGLAREWVIRPDQGLAEDSVGCSAALLLDALTRACERDLPRNIWMDAPLPAAGIEALAQRLALQDVPFADPRQPDFFGSVYGPDSWFGKSAPRPSMHHTVWRRYGARAHAHSWELAPGEAVSTSGSLSSLASRCYRVFPAPGGRPVHVGVCSRGGDRESALKAVVCQVGRYGREIGERIELTPEGEKLQGETPTLDRRVDHLLVVISHCGWKKPEAAEPEQYQLTIRG